MCLIIYKPTNDCSFSDNYITNSVGRNNDGCGAMYVKDGRVVVEKLSGTTDVDVQNRHTVEDMVEWTKALLEEHESVIIHHRFTTQGKNNEDNLHPFKVLSIDDDDPIDLYMMHNGTILNAQMKHSRENDRSDTCAYVEDYLRPILELCPELIYSPEFQAHIQSFIGTSSKLVFLDNLGEVIIINEEAGKWLSDRDGGCWISNLYSHVDRTTPKYTYNTHNNYAKNYSKVQETISEAESTNVIPLTNNISKPEPKYPAGVVVQRSSSSTSLALVPDYAHQVSVLGEEEELEDVYKDYLLETKEIVDSFLLEGYTIDRVKNLVAYQEDIAAEVILELLHRLETAAYS